MTNLRLAFLACVLSMAQLACGGDGGSGDAAPAASDGRTADARVGADAPPVATPFDDLSDAQLAVDVCEPIRDAICTAFPGTSYCPPTCDPCAATDIAASIRDVCPGNASIGDVNTCVSTAGDADGAACDGMAACVEQAMQLACPS